MKRNRVTKGNQFFSREWRALIVVNLLLTLFVFWTNYSQISYLIKVMEEKVPLAIPTPYHQTAVVINPITGSFLLVNTVTLFTIFLVVCVLVVLYFLFYRK